MTVGEKGKQENDPTPALLPPPRKNEAGAAPWKPPFRGLPPDTQPLAGCRSTDPAGGQYVTCSDASSCDLAPLTLGATHPRTPWVYPVTPSADSVDPWVLQASAQTISATTSEAIFPCLCVGPGLFMKSSENWHIRA